MAGFPAVRAAAIAEKPTDYVMDQAGVIEAGAEQRLIGQLRELEQKTGVQMIILTVPSTEGMPIESYAIDRAQHWGLGQKGKDNGLLMVVAVNDRAYRFEVGYGLESVIPDSLAGSIGRQYLVPRFKQGDYTGGISDASTVIMGTIAQAYGVQLTGVSPSPTRRQRSRGGFTPGVLFFLAVFVLSLLLPRRATFFGRRTRGFGGVWYGGSGGFGGGGGGFGGFGGGGGGGFGGGGASGGW